MIFMGLSMGPIYAGWSMITTSWFKKKNPWRYIAFLFVCFAAMVTGTVFTFIYFIQPFSKWTWYQGSEPKINTLNQLLGGLIVSIFIPFAITVLIMIWSALKQLPSLESSMVAKLYNGICKFNYSYANILSITLVALSFGLFFVLTMILPHTWAITSGTLVSSNTYFTADSPYSLVQGVLWYQGSVQHFVNVSDWTVLEALGNSADSNTTWVPTAAPTICPGNETYCADPEWLQPMVYLKLYPDVLVYYSMLFFMMSVGVFSTYNSIGRRLMHYRMDVNFIIPKIVSIWPLGMCVGELLLLCAVLALHAYWFWYWGGWGWDYRAETIYSISDDQLQLYARLFGEMTVLTMSFLTIPITHNNIWESIFGVPFDRAVRYHRVLGAVTWLFVTLHMWLWQVIWIRNGTLANNGWLSTTNLIITGTADDPEPEIRGNNFTIPIMETLWLLGSLSLTAAALRKFIPYEVFQYTHYFMIMFFLMSFVHSFQSWYFTGGGLLLYMYDKCLRLIKSSQYMEVESLRYAEMCGTTRVIISKKLFNRPYVAGQYCFINIPAVSQFEWHPFTISSSPAMDKIEFTISSRGRDTWTNRLGVYARDHTGPTQIQIDGPFGRNIPYNDHEVLILVAGGIGVTPMISMLNQIAQSLATNSQSSKIRQVHFIWVFRKIELLYEFAHMLEPIISQELLSQKIVLHLYCTATENTESSNSLQNESDTVTDSSPRYYYEKSRIVAEAAGEIALSYALEKMTQNGRPNIEQVFADIDSKISHNNDSATSSVACFVCGRPNITESVSISCYKHNYRFQAEEFSI